MATVELPGRQPLFIDLFNHRLTWSEALGNGVGEQRYDHVVVYDLSTRQRSIAARSGWRGGQIVWARGSGNNLTYLDQAAPPPGENDPKWKLYVQDLRTNHRRLLDQGPESAVTSPAPNIAGNTVVWVRPKATGGTELRVANLRTYKVRTFVSDLGVMDADTDGSFIATRFDSDQRLEVRRTSGELVATIHKQVGWFALASGYLAFTTPGLETDPTDVYLQRLPTGALVHLAGTNGGNVALSGSVVAWYGSTQQPGVIVTDTSNSQVPVAVASRDLAVPARIAVDGSDVAWGSQVFRPHLGFTTTLHVVHMQIG